MSNGKTVTSSQYRLLVAEFIAGSSLLLAYMDRTVQQDAWLVVLVSFAAILPILLCYAMLANRLPGKNLVQINDAAFGPVFGKLISLLHIGTFLLLFVFNLNGLADYYVGAVTPEMPKLALVLITLLVTAYAVAKGAKPIALFGLLSLVVSVGVILFTSLLLLKDMDFSNLLPMLESPGNKYLQSAHIFSLTFTGTQVFLMMTPSLDPGVKFRRNTISGAAIGTVLLLIVSLRNTAVLGPTTALFASNSHMAVRMISIKDILTRVELLVVISVLAALFVRIVIQFYAIITAMTAVFGLKSPRTLIVPVGGLAAVLSLVAFSSTVDSSFAALRYHAFLPMLVSFILPPVTLLVLSARQHRFSEAAVDGGGQADEARR